jgi:hypothetical protein
MVRPYIWQREKGNWIVCHFTMHNDAVGYSVVSLKSCRLWWSAEQGHTAPYPDDAAGARAAAQQETAGAPFPSAHYVPVG